MFGQKKDKHIKTMVNYYEGLPGFDQNSGCMVIEDENVITFSDPINKREAKLNKSQLISIDLLDEHDYLQKYKNTSTKGRKHYQYCIFTYKRNSGDISEIVVSGELVQIGPLRKLKWKMIDTDKPTEAISL